MVNIDLTAAGREVGGSVTFHDALYVAEDTVGGGSLTRIAEAAVPLTTTMMDVPLIFHGLVQVYTPYSGSGYTGESLS